MDRVEVARQLAARLHVDAVARGVDFWDPYAFAVAEARRRDLDVEPTAPGAAVLNGGRAAYIAADALILHENVGTPFERAFLVAHELGHAELGDGGQLDAQVGEERHARSDVGDTIDPARSAEPSPVGVDRVVDYGRRQRREVQMDLFAREFLIPRPVVRRLHLEDGMTASAIADRLGAPFAVVAQQLLDALLLPEIAPAAEAAPASAAERPLNPEQADAARHRGRAFLLEAGPGTGKTQTLVARVHDLLDEGVDARRMLLLTFSNKAAGEMAERIARRRPDAAAAMWIGTFHAFGLDLVRRFHAELGLPNDPRLMDRVEAAALLEEEFPRLGLTHYRDLYDPTPIVSDLLAAISRAKDEVIDEHAYAALAAAMADAADTAAARVAAEKAIEVGRAYAAYEQLKRRLHRVDFGDLVALPVRLIEGDPHIRAHLSETYQHVLVDEYQDVNRASVRLLLALRPDGDHLWAVGDARQSIYRFRGASSFNMSRFGTEDFAGGTRARLTRNYRSVPEIVASFSSFAAGMPAGAGSDGALVADRASAGHAPELRTVARADEVPVALADSIAAMRHAGHAYRSQAVLCTGNERLSTLGQELERLGIPVLFLGSLFERPEVKDLLALLSILADRRAMGLVRTACWPEFAMAMPDVAAVLQHLRAATEELPDGSSHTTEAEVPCGWLRDILGESEQVGADLPGVSPAGQAALRTLAAGLAGYDHASDPWTVLAVMLLDRTRIAARLAASPDIADRTRAIAIWQLLNFLRAQPATLGRTIADVLDRVRRLVRLGDDRDLRQLPAAAQGLDAVRLMTIHGAKGLEFDVVHVPGVNADTIPRTAPAPPCPPPDGMVAGGEGSAVALLRAGHAEEQECLFYVALSRARERLLLLAATQKANGHNRPLSPFLNRLGPALRRQAAVVSRTLPPDPGSGDVALAWTGGARFTDAQITLYDRCGRRFFYTHLLRIGGRRATTPYMRLHEAVRAVIDAQMRGAVSPGDLAVREDDGLGMPADDMLPEPLDGQLAAALHAHGLDGHGYADEYRRLARAMIRYFLAARRGHRPATRDPVTLRIGDDEIVVLPDELLVRADGTPVLRSVRTGHQRSHDVKSVGAAALLLGAREIAPSAVVEFVHLGDETTTEVALSPRELANRREKLNGFMRAVRAGQFPAEVSSRTCPRCPAFFVCGPTPGGVFTVGAPSGDAVRAGAFAVPTPGAGAASASVPAVS